MLDLYLNIKNYREKSGMSQEELAKLVGYKNRTSIAKIEAGKIDLPLSKIELFADALGVTPTELMGETWENEILDNARLDITNYFGGGMPMKSLNFKRQSEWMLNKYNQIL